MPSTRYSQGNGEWSEEQTLQLLHLYRDRPPLWNASDPHYSSPKIRLLALQDIAEAMGPSFTHAQILEKLEALRGLYELEERRISERQLAGRAVKTELKWFEFAHSFLKDCKPANGDAMKDDDSHDGAEDTEMPDVEAVDVKMPEHELMDIKIEPELQSATTVDTNATSNAGGNSSANGKDGSSKVSKRSAEKSLKFVTILRDYPVFWQEIGVVDQQQYKNALEEISHRLSLTKEGLQNILNHYRITYQKETKKIKNDKNYKPDLVWWPLIQDYVDMQEETKTNESAAATLSKNEESDCMENEQNINELRKKKKKKEIQLNSVRAKELHKKRKTKTKKKQKPSSLRETHIWSLKDTVKFVRLFGAHRCLWDQNDLHFSSTPMRNAAHEDIAAAMGSDLDADYVAKRIQTVRMLYMTHRKRMIEELKQNREPSFKTHLWYPLADSFLRQHTGLRSIKKDEREVPQFDYEYVYKQLHSIDPRLLQDLNVGCT